MRPGDNPNEQAAREIRVKVGDKTTTRRTVTPENESCSEKTVRYFRELMETWGWELPEFDDPAIENPIADTTDLPANYMWGTFIFYWVVFIGLAVYFFIEGYIEGRTSSFITLDNESGVCIDDEDSTTCCEVPTGVTGQFGADTGGKWSTMKGFSEVRNQYGLTMLGVRYTNEQWSNLMESVDSNVRKIGEKAVLRDFAWSLIVWVSYTTINVDRGFLKFYFQGDPGMAFNKPIYAIGFANNNSKIDPCTVRIQTDYSETDRKLSMSIDLNKIELDGSESCDANSVPCDKNPCPGILSLEAMGYDTISATSSILNTKLDMVSVTTALAVNMGMISIDNLANMVGDNDRITLFQNLVNQNIITKEVMGNTSSYFEPLYAPSNVIYCTYYADIDKSACLVRMANLLYYPVINHYGFSETGYGTPQPCNIQSSPGSAGYFYCNQFDIVVGLIYYPVPDIDIQDRIDRLTNKPSFAPSARPTPLPGDPTLRPTVIPTRRPTTLKPTFKPSQAPTFRPTPLPGDPTLVPTIAPSARPTKVPSARPSHFPTSDPVGPSYSPSARPSRNPTFSPSGPSYTPSQRPSQTPTLDPTGPSYTPTERPTRAPSSPPTGPSYTPTERPSRTPTNTPVARRRLQTDDFYAAAADDNYYDSYYYDYYYDAYYYDAYYYDYYFGGYGGYFYYSFYYYYYDYDASGSYADDDVEATTETTIGILEDDYEAFLVTDDFTPAIPQLEDLGEIIHFARAMAVLIDESTITAEIQPNMLAYRASIDTIQTDPEEATYASSFNRLCGAVNMDTQGYKSGCAMLAINFFGGDNRVASIMNFQPGVKMRCEQLAYSGIGTVFITFCIYHFVYI